MQEKTPITIFWFRRDLRLEDNHGLYQALSLGQSVLPLFIFDDDILDPLPKDDHRVNFIYDELTKIHAQLKDAGSSLLVKKGRVPDVFRQLFKEYEITRVLVNADYEPQARQRDGVVMDLCEKHEVIFRAYKDQVALDPTEVLKKDDTPYLVYTAYARAWRRQLETARDLKNYTDTSLFQNFLGIPDEFPQLNELGFQESIRKILPYQLDNNLLQEYGSLRDFPYEYASSRLGPHLRFGTVSIRKIIHQALSVSEQTFLSELIWREFFMSLLYHFPHTVDQAFRPEYDHIVWRNNPDEFKRWKEGETGFPLVDAGMRQLRETGYLHNRVRMVVASFLVKDLLIDWRWGERYFAEQLFDFDLSSNVGNWQWVAGTGVDAAPYFRIFNPETQQKKFDPKGIYIKRWVPEYSGFGYRPPMIDRKKTRERTLGAYQAAREHKQN